MSDDSDKPFKKGDGAMFRQGSDEIWEVESCEPISGAPGEFKVYLKGFTAMFSARDLLKARRS